MEKSMCSFCAKWFESKDVYPLYEKGSKNINKYCEKCYPGVKSSIRSLPYSHLYRWGEKGANE